MQEHPHTREIVIVGAGAAGAMAGAALARTLPRGRYSIRIVSTADDADPFDCAAASLPALSAFHDRIGIDEDALLAEAGGAFSLGTAFTGWSTPGRTYFLPFGDTGAPLGSVAFHHLAARLRAAGRPVRLADHSLAAITAQAGRFARPAGDPRSPLSTLAYGLHLPRAAYARFLIARALGDGAELTGARFAGAELAADGRIAAVRLDSGERVAGDLFLDCSGPAGLLIGGALGTGFESWRRWLPCTRTLELIAQATTPPAPYAHVEALSGGWRRTVPLRERTGHLLAWSGEMDAPMAAELRRGAGRIVAERETAIEPGRRAAPWTRNCIALGAAAAVLEPLGGIGLHLVHSALARLVSLFPRDGDAPLEAAEYNRQTIEEMERARDFVILRYKTNGRVGEPLWDQCRAMDVPEPLARKIVLYQSRGRVPMYDGETFDRPDWIATLDEHGVRPRRYDPLADAIPAVQVERHVARLRELILGAVATLPSHADYLRRHVGAGKVTG
ncbi:MAG: tryptophan halogenase family protein [Allosphingosinicella sp.]|uniref:tryptophan halogenase family protein n=1 Tax=Allosphingosinicella sp. TaxID=2823234 RepID=UPI00393B55E2